MEQDNLNEVRLSDHDDNDHSSSDHSFSQEINYREAEDYDHNKDPLSAEEMEDYGETYKNPMLENGMLPFLPPILQEVAKQGGYFNIEADGGCKISGFYKNGPMMVYPNQSDSNLTAVDKRKRKTTITSYHDLAELNFEWWKASNTKSNYRHPEKPWIEYFIEQNWVKRKIIYVVNEEE